MLEKLKNKIEAKRAAKNIFWFLLVLAKDYLWWLGQIIETQFGRGQMKFKPSYLKIRKQLSLPPIIIGGTSRSGTTLLLSILSAHPDIFAIPFETYAFANPWNKNQHLTPPLRLDKIYQCLADYEIPKNCHRWCEKTPWNIFWFNDIFRLFKGRVKLIFIVRDGRDAVLSIKSNNPNRPFAQKVEDWTEEAEAALIYKNNPLILGIKYEDLVLNYEATIRKVLNFIGEEFDERILLWDQYATVQTHRAWAGPARPLFSDSIGKWKKPEYQSKIEELLQNPKVIYLLKELGYLD
ncbi:MAG: sulfotransferase [Candidatus Buchananbacteria bacterium]